MKDAKIYNGKYYGKDVNNNMEGGMLIIMIGAAVLVVCAIFSIIIQFYDWRKGRWKTIKEWKEEKIYLKKEL